MAEPHHVGRPTEADPILSAIVMGDGLQHTTVTGGLVVVKVTTVT